MKRTIGILAVCTAVVAMAAFGCGGADSPTGGSSGPKPGQPTAGKARFSGEFTGYHSRKDPQ